MDRRDIVPQIADNDIEKRGEIKSTDIDVTAVDSSETVPSAIHTFPSFKLSEQDENLPNPVLRGKLAKWNAMVEALAGLEARGIRRVLPEEKNGGGRRGYVQMFLLWFSMNLVVLNTITGLLGPLVFQLGWVDSVCIVIFANALAACGPAYTSTFGPETGNRTMVRVREGYRCQSNRSFYIYSTSLDTLI